MIQAHPQPLLNTGHLLWVFLALFSFISVYNVQVDPNSTTLIETQTSFMIQVYLPSLLWQHRPLPCIALCQSVPVLTWHLCVSWQIILHFTNPERDLQVLSSPHIHARVIGTNLKEILSVSSKQSSSHCGWSVKTKQLSVTFPLFSHSRKMWYMAKSDLYSRESID